MINGKQLDKRTDNRGEDGIVYIKLNLQIRFTK